MRAAPHTTVFVLGALASVAFPALMLATGDVGVWSTIVEAGILPFALYVSGAVAWVMRPANIATFRLMAIGAAHMVGYALAPVASLLAGSTVPGAWAVNLVAGLTYSIGFGGFVALFAVFPDGRYPSPRWRTVTRVTVVACACTLVVAFLGQRSPELTADDLHPGHTSNPLFVHALAPLRSLELVAIACVPVALALFVLRYRRSAAAVRRQLRWPLAAAALSALVLILYFTVGRVVPGVVRNVAFLVAFSLLPASMMVAMVQRELFDVRRVARRSWEATRTLGASLDDESDLRELPAVIASTLRDALGAEWVRVVLRGRPGTPDGMSTASAGAPGDAPAVLSRALHYSGTELGHVECGPRETGDYRDSDHDLLRSLARQSELAVGAARLAAELGDRLVDLEQQTRALRTSRTRIVQAAEVERRRIERDIHDGIQQEIVALMAQVELARTQLQLDPDTSSVAETLDEARSLIRQTQADLRELVRGIHPALLGDRGLCEAIESRLVRLPLVVDVIAGGAVRSERFAPEIEGAAYFVVSEALANVMKHAATDHATVELILDKGELTVRVSDTGRGFSPTGAIASGTGIEGLRDRVEALGGSFDVVTTIDGTCVSAVLSARDRSAARA